MTTGEGRRPELVLTDVPTERIRAALAGPLMAFNVRQSGVDDYRSIGVLLNDAQGNPIGGMWGRTAFGWLYVELLYLPEEWRGRGVGTEVMRQAEAEAIRRGCRNVWLDTFEFQARGFYEKIGYRCFAELPDYPLGWTRYFMTKTLA